MIRRLRCHGLGFPASDKGQVSTYRPQPPLKLAPACIIHKVSDMYSLHPPAFPSCSRLRQWRYAKQCLVSCVGHETVQSQGMQHHISEQKLVTAQSVHSIQHSHIKSTTAAMVDMFENNRSRGARRDQANQGSAHSTRQQLQASRQRRRAPLPVLARAMSQKIATRPGQHWQWCTLAWLDTRGTWLQCYKRQSHG